MTYVLLHMCSLPLYYLLRSAYCSIKCKCDSRSKVNMGNSGVTYIDFVLLEEHAFFLLQNDPSMAASFLIINCIMSNEYIMTLISVPALYSDMITTLEDKIRNKPVRDKSNKLVCFLFPSLLSYFLFPFFPYKTPRMESI